MVVQLLRVVLTILLAARSLDDHIRAVARALDGIEPARLAVGMIVGRDTSTLNEGDISRAAIETGAENLSDGVFAPGFWFLIAGLAGPVGLQDGQHGGQHDRLPKCTLSCLWVRCSKAG